MKKSKSIFLFLAIMAVIMLIVISAGIAEGSILTVIIGLLLFISIFGIGFTQKKKYRENGWL
ncbi:DUF5325 family protein [Macrococcus equipercicus]|uniref:DUF5325 family protein n=1 Tax=Macrococcus equipercicus TaxID=69967 RepID=A0A9Q9F286_9STAP|nr:DUF5325 family protein [Macrococcus equipercicus]KAA1042678.1 hypothetical protein ERX35_002005 [Macrococcus equipercicus]UTH14545.1 DUF5325 family protein [Macrococcus equipercicus]